jgi:cellobiose-specific phosphotransferase system component IIC
MKILQHSSTLVGELVIVFALFKLPPDKNVTGQLNIKYWSILTILTLTIIAVRLLCGLDYKLYGNFIVTVISAGLISLTLTPWLTRQKP